MGKKDKKSKDSKKERSAEKLKRNLIKAESKSKKFAKKSGDDEDDEQDLDAILENYAREQEKYEEVKIEVCRRPSRRLNPTMIANTNNNKRELILFGGESVVGSKSEFYNDLFLYNVENDTWRKITSRNSPLPRSSHAMSFHPSGLALLFGGEFSSPKQSTFFHYGDTWILDCDTKEWTKIEQKNGPIARSGHRITCWKNYFILHGGFRDLGAMTTYLNDLWVFDITNYKWQKVEFSFAHSVPDPRSGHSLIPCPEGAILQGGYCRIKTRKGGQKGKVLTDSWILKMKSDPKAITFERRKKQGFSPSPRVGCSLVQHKNRGIMFGGVFDYEESEDKLESEFYNDLFAYQIESNRWYKLSIRPKRKVQVVETKDRNKDEDLENILNSILAKANLDEKEDDNEVSEIEKLRSQEESEDCRQNKNNYPVMNHLPHPLSNSCNCVVDDTLYIFGGIYEKDDREFNLDCFYAIDLVKLDGVKVLWEDFSELENEPENSDEGSDSDEEEEGEHEVSEHQSESEDENENEDDNDVDGEYDIEEPEENNEIEDPRPWLPCPKPFESLRSFYVRTGPDFLHWAISSNRDKRGKQLKKVSFDLCEDRFWERREQIAITEDQLGEVGAVEEVIEREGARTRRR